jgi:hypothetical protein
MFSIVKVRHIPIIASPTTGYWTYIAPSFPILGFIFTLSLVNLVARVWKNGPKGSWKRGVKDLHRTPTSNVRHGCSVFGHRRLGDDDDTHILVMKATELSGKVVAWLRSWLKQTVYRHIECVIKAYIYVLFNQIHSGVENVHFAITRNVVAIILLTILAVYAVILFWHVVNESFDTREMWAPFLGDYNYDNGILNMWSVYVS